jgi:hypothetical protein
MAAWMVVKSPLPSLATVKSKTWACEAQVVDRNKRQKKANRFIRFDAVY